jgi:hypothetical protein
MAPKAAPDQTAVLTGLIAEMIETTRNASAELRADFNQKHRENQEVRDALRARVDDLGTRLSVAETTLRTIVGDNTGDSGLLHDMKRGQDQMKESLSEAREEFRRGMSNMTADLRELKQTASSAPATRDWMQKWMGVGAFVGIVASVIAVLVGVLTVIHYLAAMVQRMPVK